MDRDLERKLIASCKPEEPVAPEDYRHFDFDAPELRLRGAPRRERLAEVIDLASEPTAQPKFGFHASSPPIRSWPGSQSQTWFVSGSSAEPSLRQT